MLAKGVPERALSKSVFESAFEADCHFDKVAVSGKSPFQGNRRFREIAV